MRLQYLTDEGIQYLKGNFEANLPRYIQRDSAYFADLLKKQDFLQDTGYDFNSFASNLQVTDDASTDDVHNAEVIHRALSDLPYYMAIDEKIWAACCTPIYLISSARRKKTSWMRMSGITRIRFTILSSPIRDTASAGEPSSTVLPVFTGALRWSTTQATTMIPMVCLKRLRLQDIRARLSSSRPAASLVGGRHASASSRQSANCVWRKSGMSTAQQSSQASNTSISSQD